ncbi:hypothetical protein JCM10212_000584 [Sporobolomyces blumeae]
MTPPSSPVPFPTSPAPPAVAPSRPLPVPAAALPSIMSTHATPIRSPRSSQDSTTSRKRLSIASTTSTRSTASLARPPALALRTRHTSLPASVVQSRHVSIVGTSANNLAVKIKSMNRVSVASVASFGSVEEEGEDEEGAGGGRGKGRPSRQTVEGAETRSNGSGALAGPSKPVRPRAGSRHSLPASAFPSLTAAVSPSPNRQRSSSPLERAGSKQREQDPEHRRLREERRLRIAEELRDTELAYVQVLEEIDANYHQPLLQALPAVDPLSRRKSHRQSTTFGQALASDTSPRTSVHSSVASGQTPAGFKLPTDLPVSGDPKVGGAILSRREINEVFSNFTDVLNLSHVMLVTLNEAVPPRPSDPLAIGSQLSTRSETHGQAGGQAGSVETELSRSGGTIESSGPETPPRAVDTRDGVLDVPSTSKIKDRKRQESTRRRASPAPPLRLGKALLPIVPFFKQYSLFVANFSGSLARLSALERGTSTEDAERWRSFVRTRHVSANGSKIGLGGMLLSIVQRVPRYRLLLADLVKHTEDDHPDLKDLKTAFELVDSVATHLDSQIELHTHDLSVLDLQRSFSNLDFVLIAPGRRLLKSGELRKLNRAGKEQVRAFFLFSDLLLHAAVEGNAPWTGFGLPSGVDVGPSAGPDIPRQYRLLDKFELEDVTVVGTEEGTLRYGFEILTTQKSFAVFADSLDAKLAWLEAVRTAKADLMSDRRTLQRSTIFDLVSASKSDRRISLPSPSKRETVGTLAVPMRQASHQPVLGTIPPTPANELESLSFDLPVSATLPIPADGDPALPASPAYPTSISPTSLATTVHASSSKAAVPSHRLSASRMRRWSEIRPSTAVSVIASAFTSSPPEPDEAGLADDEVEYKVIEAYHAPVWVPDSKADKCMRCGDAFGVWRRRHHCRLCGGVVCWACSTKHFIIPGFLLTTSASGPQEDRLARSCDACYSAVFDAPPPASRFLGTSAPPKFGRSTLQPCVDKTATLHRLSRIVRPREMPIFDDDAAALGHRTSSPPTHPTPERHGSVNPAPPAPAKTPETPKRRRRLTAAGQLRELLSRQNGP